MSILVYSQGELAVDSRVVLTLDGTTFAEDSGIKYRYSNGNFTFHNHQVLMWAYTGSNMMARAWDYRYQQMDSKGEHGFLSYADTSRFLVLEEDVIGEQIIITDGPVYVASLDGTLYEYPTDATIVLGDARDCIPFMHSTKIAAWIGVAMAIRRDGRCGGAIHRFTFKNGTVQTLKHIDHVHPLITLYQQAKLAGKLAAITAKKKLTFK